MGPVPPVDPRLLLQLERRQPCGNRLSQGERQAAQVADPETGEHRHKDRVHLGSHIHGHRYRARVSVKRWSTTPFRKQKTLGIQNLHVQQQWSLPSTERWLSSASRPIRITPVKSDRLAQTGLTKCVSGVDSAGCRYENSTGTVGCRTHTATIEGLTRVVLRGTISDGTYGTHKNLPGTYFTIFTDNIWFYLLWSPVIVCVVVPVVYPGQSSNNLPESNHCRYFDVTHRLYNLKPGDNTYRPRNFHSPVLLRGTIVNKTKYCE